MVTRLVICIVALSLSAVRECVVVVGLGEPLLRSQCVCVCREVSCCFLLLKTVLVGFWLGWVCFCAVLLVALLFIFGGFFFFLTFSNGAPSNRAFCVLFNFLVIFFFGQNRLMEFQCIPMGNVASTYDHFELQLEFRNQLSS